MSTPRAPLPNPLTQEDVSKIKGTDVYGADDRKLGSIDTVLINPQSKAIDRLVVKSGGVLGVGGRDVAIAIDQFNWDSAREGFRLSKTADQLKAMPDWKAANAGASGSAPRVTTPASSGASGTAGSSGMGAGTTTPGTPSK
ncbi:MAG: PRC-barrel domain-containing protein [Proteobacteria bacterium]|nr:PRC-barrel domain-containing protein [Pseudomonadota bacterium]